MSGLEKLTASVQKDCNEPRSCGCFNPEGCNVVGARIGKYGEEGYKSCCHKYCDKFKWVVDRAKHYGEKLGIPWEQILDSWESERNYWYMNYYQDCNQPEIEDGKVRVFDTVEDFRKAVGSAGFRCPCCGGVSKSPYVCDAGTIRSDGSRCDWKVYGLFRGLGKDIFVYCKDQVRGERIFMPIAWEEETT